MQNMFCSFENRCNTLHNVQKPSKKSNFPFFLGAKFKIVKNSEIEVGQFLAIYKHSVEYNFVKKEDYFSN